jgi:hypothetical protein
VCPVWKSSPSGMKAESMGPVSESVTVGMEVRRATDGVMSRQSIGVRRGQRPEIQTGEERNTTPNPRLSK